VNAVIESPVKLSISRSFDSSPESIFDAWLQESWGDWVGSPDKPCVSCEVDPRVGGMWRIRTHTQDGSEVLLTGVHKEINRPSRLVFTFNSRFSGPGDTIVTLTFKPRGAGTEMTLTHEGFITQEMRDAHILGWNRILDRLQAF
jgi:uncharacterized protein YndB with AHSA1/START domain